MGNKPFKHAMLMSGGSSRFGYYLGMYAAAKQSGQTPDLILASCGGAIAAGLIACFPDEEEQKIALLSEEMYLMQKRIVAKKSLTNALRQALFRFFRPTPIDTYPDFYADAIFSIVQDTERDFFPFSHGAFDSNPATHIAIIGSKLDYTRAQMQQPRGQNTVFQEVVFSTPTVVEKMVTFDYLPSSNLINTTLCLLDNCSLSNAVRASVGDIFYVSPIEWGTSLYMGGMINLAPFEYAQYLAELTTFEKKQAFNVFTATPAFKRVLGFDPNQRLQELHQQHPNQWVDTRDSGVVLRQYQSKKHAQWLRNCIEIHVPSYQDYRAAMLQQWQYGYERGKSGMASH